MMFIMHNKDHSQKKSAAMLVLLTHHGVWANISMLKYVHANVQSYTDMFTILLKHANIVVVLVIIFNTNKYFIYLEKFLGFSVCKLNYWTNWKFDPVTVAITKRTSQGK